jgi:hypothetical protein
MAFAPSTVAREAERKDDIILSIPMHDNVAIFKGSLVLADATTGGARPVYATGTTADCFMGVAYESVDNTLTGHTSLGKSIRVHRTGSFIFKIAATATQANVGSAAYTDVSSAGTPDTVTTAASKASYVGIITEFIDATHVRVAICTNDILNLGAA